MLYDLHVHTKDSDGNNSRLEILKKAEEMKFEYLSFTDHDYISTDNIKKIYEKKYGKCHVNIIEGVEFSVSDYKNMHILSYDIKNLKLVKKRLDDLRKENIEICKRIITNLNNYYHFNLDPNEYPDFQITRGLIRRMIVDKKYEKSIYQAGILYTGEKSKFYIEPKYLKLEEIIKLVKEANGLLFLAHPSTLKLNNDSLNKLVKHLKSMGLDGIEILNTSKTTKEQMKYYESLAKKYDLLISCGSDYHDDKQTLGINNDKIEQLIKVIKER